MGRFFIWACTYPLRLEAHRLSIARVYTVVSVDLRHRRAVSKFVIVQYGLAKVPNSGLHTVPALKCVVYFPVAWPPIQENCVYC